MNSVESAKPLMFAPSPLVRLRIARRRLVLEWNESEHFQPLCVAAAIIVVLVAAMAAIVVEVMK
jgi:hypothetical protein